MDLIRRGLLVLTTLALLLVPTWAEARPRVVDRGALFPSTERELEARLAEIFEETGVDVHLLVVNRLDGRTAGEVAREQPIWSTPGPRMLVLMSLDERQVRIETDPSLRAAHSDAAWANLIETRMLPSLRASRHATALRLGVEAIRGELLGGDANPRPLRRRSFDALRDTLFVLFAGLLAGLSFNRLRREQMWRARW